MGHERAPRARQEGLVVQPVEDELLVFDSERGRAHSLNATAAAVWQACDGERDRRELATECGIDEDTLELALERLSAAHLVDGAEAPVGVSRRLMIRRTLAAGAALGAAIPVIRSITAPTPAMAMTHHKGKGMAGKHCTHSASCSASPASTCNAVVHSCQRRTNQSCSNTSSCLHNGSSTIPCVSGLCRTCSQSSQCPGSHPVCHSTSGFCH